MIHDWAAVARDEEGDVELRAELQNLRKREAHLRDFIETSSFSLHWVGADGTILWANQAELDLHGYSRQEYVGKSILQFHVDSHVIEEMLGRLKRGETLHEYPARLRHRDGSILHVLINSSALFEDGKFIHTRCFTRDVTRETKNGQHYRDLFQALPAAVYTTDEAGYITSFNQAAVDFAGRVPKLGADTWCVSWKLYKPDGTVLPHDQCPMATALKEGRPIRGIEAIAERPDGTRRHFIPFPTPLYDSSGKLTGAVNMLVDITDRKTAENALRGSEELLAAELADSRLLQEISAQLIEDGDEDALYSRIMDAVVVIMRSDFATMQMLHPERGAGGELGILASRGLTPDEAKVWEWVGIDTGSTCGQALRTKRRAIATNVAKSDFLKGTEGADALRRAGIHAAQSTPLFSRHGKLLGMISSHWRRPHTPTERDLRLLDILARQAADLVERKRGERMRAQLSAIVESSGDAIYLCDFDGRILTWNAAAEELYEFSASEMIGRGADEILSPETRAEFDVIFTTGKIVKNLEAVCTKRGGSVFPAVLTISPVRNDAGKLFALSIVARDVTARKCAEDDLRQANQDLEQVAYSASHHLQEPLRSIQIFSELLTLRHANTVAGESAEFLGYLRSAAARMETLVRGLLSYTGAARLAPATTTIDTNGALREALANLADAIGESRATVTSDSLPALPVHSTHLCQLFQNLVGNAIQFRSADRLPAVHITALRESGSWVFAVKDNGIGIEPQYKEQVFGLFTRLHNADCYEGSGIGLALCQRIVERYRGRIWVESEFGRGSEFRFVFPR